MPIVTAVCRILYEGAPVNAMVDELLSRELKAEFEQESHRGLMANKGTCKATDCNREVIAKGYCRKHYRLWTAWRDAEAALQDLHRGEMPQAAVSRQPVRGALEGRTRQEGR